MSNLLNQFNKWSFRKLVLLGLSVFLIFCGNKQTRESEMFTGIRTNNYSIPYQLQKPTKEIDLPLELREISGLSYYNDNQLVCHHDEMADIFTINYVSGEVKGKYKSDKAGDYEGIEYVKCNVYLLKSNGTITEYSNFNTKKQQKKSYKTKISMKNDAEGLAYDPKSQSLLIACKSKPSLKDAEKKRKNKRCVYQFSLQQKELIEKPFLCINLKKIEERYGKGNFMPSAIALCPLDNNFYVLSAVGKKLLIIDRNSNIIHLEKLPPMLYSQPEGICFSPDGKHLFISNEAKIGKSNILVFERLAK